jgi:hypothetical protein
MKQVPSSLGLFLDPEDGGDILLKRQLIFNGLHKVISQKIELLGFVYLYLFICFSSNCCSVPAFCSKSYFVISFSPVVSFFNRLLSGMVQQ